jgi:hypothetical protein
MDYNMDYNMEHKFQDIEGYILRSKRQINILLDQHNYLSAFNILVIVLSKLDEVNRRKFINYYNNYIHTINDEKYTENSKSLFPVSRY